MPDLMLAIKVRVDRDAAPGQFLLTGSANILTAPRIADALTGRAEYLRLAPLSQGELHGIVESFIPDLFEGRWPQITAAPIGRAAYAQAIVAGGYPAALNRTETRRTRFFESYLDTILQRDLATIARVHDQANVRRLLAAVASTSASLVNFESLSRDLEPSVNSLRSYATLLEALFLVHRAEAWSSNLLARLIKSPKAYVSDSGLHSFLVGADTQRVIEDPLIAGMLFETFAITELRRQASWQNNAPRLYHFRDRDQREVDVVLERRDGSVAAVEVKAAAVVTSSDFRGLRHLQDRLGGRFKAGIVLYTGEGTVPFGERLAAVPLSGLWASTSQ